jgi:hypothetical protein
MQFSPSAPIRFQPSVHSGYGDGTTPAPAPPAAPAESDDISGYLQYMPFVKSLLGIDDPRNEAERLKSILNILKAGNAVQRFEAKLKVCGVSCSADQAIAQVEGQLAEINIQAEEFRKRAKLFTGIAIGGAVFMALSATLVGVKIYNQIQAGRAATAALKQQQAGG